MRIRCRNWWVSDATVPLVTTYESHPIVNDLAGKATGFPDLALARNQERR